MGNYIEQSDLETVIPAAEFLEMTDRTNTPPSEADAAVVASAITAAEGRIHRCLARRYQLPLPASDSILMGIIKPIAIDYAWEALAPRPDMSDQALLDRTAAHDKYLISVRDGLEDLPATSPLPGPDAGGAPVVWSAGKRRAGVDLP